MQFEEKIIINASAEKIFKVYEKVSEWPSWDPDCKKAELNGPFVSGAEGVIYPHGGPKSRLRFTQVTPSTGFKVECNLPFCVMKFDHKLTSVNGKTQALHRVSFVGFFAPIFGRLIGSGLKKSLPKALAGLKNISEK
jgi:hypothetical protein